MGLKLCIVNIMYKKICGYILYESGFPKKRQTQNHENKAIFYKRTFVFVLIIISIILFIMFPLQMFET